MNITQLYSLYREVYLKGSYFSPVYGSSRRTARLDLGAGCVEVLYIVPVKTLSQVAFLE